MDPSLFHLDWDRLGEVLSTVVVLSILLERALAIVFEHRQFIPWLDKNGMKMPIAFVTSLIVCVFWKFDALSMIVLRDSTHPLGYVITAAVIAGGSKGSVKLFRDVLGWRSKAYEELQVANATRSSVSGGPKN